MRGRLKIFSAFFLLKFSKSESDETWNITLNFSTLLQSGFFSSSSFYHLHPLNGMFQLPCLHAITRYKFHHSHIYVYTESSNKIKGIRAFHVFLRLKRVFAFFLLSVWISHDKKHIVGFFYQFQFSTMVRRFIFYCLFSFFHLPPQKKWKKSPTLRCILIQYIPFHLFHNNLFIFYLFFFSFFYILFFFCLKENRKIEKNLQGRMGKSYKTYIRL